MDPGPGGRESVSATHRAKDPLGFFPTGNPMSKMERYRKGE